MSSQVSKKEYLTLWGVMLTVMFLYSLFNLVAQSSAPHPTAMMAWEEQIPFVPLFILPYQTLYFVIVALMIVLRERVELWRLFFRFMFIFLISYAFFLFIPLTCVRTHPPMDDALWLYQFLFYLIDQNDLPYNQLPSLHVSSIVVYWYSLRGHLKNRYLKHFVFFWFVLVGVSTIFVYQHHFLDLPTGWLLGIMAVWIFNEKRIRRIKKL